jgi:very-short-patch-repair endonuclease
MLSKNKERKLVALYPFTDDEVIAKQLGVGLWVIRKKAEELGLEKEDADEWTRVEIDYLVRNYKHFSNEVLSEEIGKSKMEVEHFAFRMGLSKNPDFFSNIIVTDEEKELVKEWGDEYSKQENGSSRGNFILGKILEIVFPMSQIVSEHPIGGLRLDFYIPRMELGFEFDGVQHKEHNSFFYETKADFHKAQNRDYQKSDMCQQMGIAIVRFGHDESLSVSLVRAKINEVL